MAAPDAGNPTKITSSRLNQIIWNSLYWIQTLWFVASKQILTIDTGRCDFNENLGGKCHAKFAESAMLYLLRVACYTSWEWKPACSIELEWSSWLYHPDFILNCVFSIGKSYKPIHLYPIPSENCDWCIENEHPCNTIQTKVHWTKSRPLRRPQESFFRVDVFWKKTPLKNSQAGT